VEERKLFRIDNVSGNTFFMQTIIVA